MTSATLTQNICNITTLNNYVKNSIVLEKNCYCRITIMNARNKFTYFFLQFF